MQIFLGYGVEGEKVKVEEKGQGSVSHADWRDEGTPGYVITVDYRESVHKGGTWPGGRAALQGHPPRGVRARKKQDDARYIYISYTLLADLHLFEQVNKRARVAVPIVVYSRGNKCRGTLRR